MDKLNFQNNSQEVYNQKESIERLQNVRNSSGKISQHEKSNNLVKLPGQIISKSSSYEVITEKLRINDEFLKLSSEEFQDDNSFNSSSEEFDLELFQKSNQSTKKIIQFQESDNNNNKNINKTFLKIFGVEFEIEILQQRNKDPVLFLKWVFIVTLILCMFFTLTFILGLNFRLVPLFLTITNQILATFILASYSKKPIKNGVKLYPKFAFLIFISGSIYMLLFIYSYLVQMPFNSLPLFVIATYVQLITFNFVAALIFTPNSTPFDDPNYQLKFFAPRVMAGFFNGTGVIDALSDIVLGIQLIQQHSKKFLVIGVFLFVLCNTDYIQVYRRVLMPKKVGLVEQLFTVVVEGIVLVLTTIVLFDVSKMSQDEENNDFLFVTVISITTTVINLSHNLVLVYAKIYPQ